VRFPVRRPSRLMPAVSEFLGTLWPLGLSLAALLLGMLWMSQAVDREDLRWAGLIHAARLPAWLDRLVQLLRPLGRSWFQWGLVLLVVAVWPRAGLVLAVALTLCLAIERVVKVLVRRPRPFLSRPEMRPSPSLTPSDPGFPSGDSARAWLLACFLASLPGVTPGVAAGGLAAAFMVSFGRIRLGVHTPLDAMAGAGLGAGLGLAAGLWLTRFG
jgi:membrane-associated phospholipid phosphatase